MQKTLLRYFEEQIKKPIKWSTAANQKLLDAFAEYGKNQFDRIQKEKFPIIVSLHYALCIANFIFIFFAKRVLRICAFK